jgi:hypothetical protein
MVGAMFQSPFKTKHHMIFELMNVFVVHVLFHLSAKKFPNLNLGCAKFLHQENILSHKIKCLEN